MQPRWYCVDTTFTIHNHLITLVFSLGGCVKGRSSSPIDLFCWCRGSTFDDRQMGWRRWLNAVETNIIAWWLTISFNIWVIGILIRIWINGFGRCSIYYGDFDKTRATGGLMSITLAFVALGCRTNSRGSSALISVVPFKTLTFDVIPMWRSLGTRPMGLGR